MAMRKQVELNRLEKLVALSRDPGATEAERLAAAAKVRDLQMFRQQVVVRQPRAPQPAVVRHYIEMMETEV